MAARQLGLKGMHVLPSARDPEQSEAAAERLAQPQPSRVRDLNSRNEAGST